MNITKETLKEFRKDVEAALVDVEKKWGVKVDAGNAKYDSLQFTLSLSVTRTDIDVQKLQFQENLQYCGLNTVFSADDYEREFKDGKKTMKIIGFKPGNKYEVITREVGTGKEYVYPRAYIKTLLNK